MKTREPGRRAGFLRSAALAALLGGAGMSAAAAQTAPTDAQRVAAAGYKAAFTCSATFVAGQTAAEIGANELTGIYPDLRAALATLPAAKIDERARRVSVGTGTPLGPRLAQHKPGTGCTLLAPGAGPEQADGLAGWTEALPPPPRDRSTLIGPDAELTGAERDRAALAPLARLAFNGERYGAGTQTSALLVVRGGEVVLEDYARGIDAETPQRAWSVSKTLSALLVGAARQQGLAPGLDQEGTLSHWNHPADPRRAVTLRHLLSMSSGLDSGERSSRTDALYLGGARVLDDAVTRQLSAPPGTRFSYSNRDTLAALRMVREAMGDDAAWSRFPYEALLHPIGAFRTTLETDSDGDLLASSQVWTTARDLARLGQLMLQEGEWRGQTLIHPSWIELMTSPQGPQPQATHGYGLQTWLLRGEGIPPGAYAAMGHRGQYLAVLPSHDLVLVRRGYDPSGGTPFAIAEFVRDVAAALDRADMAALEAQMAASEAESLLSDERVEPLPDDVAAE